MAVLTQENPAHSQDRTAIIVQAQIASRWETMQALEQQRGNGLDEEILRERLSDAWEAFDLLIAKCGLEEATALLLCESKTQAACAYLGEKENRQ